MPTYTRLSVSVLLTTVALLLSQEAHSCGITSFATLQQGASAKEKPAGKARPTADEITDAKARNLVWVNTSTRVYHNSSSPLYGTTERGKFMKEDDAKKAGYRIANESRAQRTSQSKAGRKD